MLIVLSVSIISVILAYFAAYGYYERPILLKTAFFLMAFLQIIHFDFGNDYMGYYTNHLIISGLQISDLAYLRQVGSGELKDIGWAVLDWLFPGTNGFFLLVAIISIVQNLIYYRLIKDYLAPKDRWKAVAIYLFTSSYYLQSFSGLRQGFAISLCILAVMLAAKNKFNLSLLICLFAGTIHLSSLVMLPFIFLFKAKLNKGHKYATILFICTIVLFGGTIVVKNVFDILLRLVPAFSRNYGHYLEDMTGDGMSVGLGFLLNSVVYFVILFFIYYRFDRFSHAERVLILLSFVPIMLLPFQMTISGLISRIGNYFSIFQIVTIPLLYHQIKNKNIRIGLGFVFSFMMFFQLYEFLLITEWSSNSYRTFHTIFSQWF